MFSVRILLLRAVPSGVLDVWVRTVAFASVLAVSVMLFFSLPKYIVCTNNSKLEPPLSTANTVYFSVVAKYTFRQNVRKISVDVI